MKKLHNTRYIQHYYYEDPIILKALKKKVPSQQKSKLIREKTKLIVEELSKK